MKKQTLSAPTRHIEHLYEMEASRDYYEATERTVTFNFPAADACMLAAIAKRFGKSTAAFGGELFAEDVRQLFIALTPDDRRKLALEADAEQTRYEESKVGPRLDLDGNPSPCNQWQRYADICDEQESKEAAK
jgi:hypothetical protein